MISKVLKQKQLLKSFFSTQAQKVEATKVKVGKISQVIGAVVDV